VRIVNAVADAYFKLRNQDESERVELLVKLLEEERNRRAVEVSALRRNLQESSAKVAGTDSRETAFIVHGFRRREVTRRTAGPSDHRAGGTGNPEGQDQVGEELRELRQTEVSETLLAKSVEEHARCPEAEGRLAEKANEAPRDRDTLCQTGSGSALPTLNAEVRRDEQALQTV